MSDLGVEIRALIDAAQPVSADEAMRRARLVPSPTVGSTEIGVRRQWWRAAAVGASAVVIGSAGLAWAALSSSGLPPGNHRAESSQTRLVLTAAEVRRIAARSASAAASSGTARVTETSSQSGVPQLNETVAVTFEGANIDEVITVDPVPPGSAAAFKTDDRMVDGQFYIYTPGPGDVPEWMHDTDSANDATSMQFPDPRTLYSALSPAAQFEVIGTSQSNGITLTKLQALDPSGINTEALAGLAQGSLSSFEMTVDQNDVVQQLTFASEQTQRECRFIGSAAQLKRDLEKNGVTLTPGDRLQFAELEKRGVVALAKSADGKAAKWVALPAQSGEAVCGPVTSSTQVTVSFSNLGAPESVTAPHSTVDFQGKG
jgi:hypothetical protein